MEAKQSKKLVITILIIATILGAASIGAAYYFNNIENLSPTESSAAKGCGCYYIDTASGISSCADASPKDAYDYKAGTVDSTGKCTAQCDLRLAPETQNGETIITCNTTGISAVPRCLNLSVEDSNGKRVVSPIGKSEEITIKAYFNEPKGDEDVSLNSNYESFYFFINGEKFDVPAEEVLAGTGYSPDNWTESNDELIDSTNYQITTTMSSYGDSDKLSIQAFANDLLISDITSEACLREFDIRQPTEAACTSLNAEFLLNSNEIQVTELSLDTSSISESSEITIDFTIDGAGVASTKSVSAYYSNGTILLDKAFIFGSSNFQNSGIVGDIINSDLVDYETEISAQVKVDGNSIDSTACSNTYDVTPSNTDPVTPADTGDPTDTIDDTDDVDEPIDPVQDAGKEEGDTSDFTVTKTGTPNCLERAAPNNQTSYTITIRNNDDTYEDIQTIVDKLPLGFTYVAGSSTINGAAIADADYVTVTTVGSAQQISWDATNNWSVAAGDILTITFSALVNTNALTGDNMNEVVVTPVNTPTDPNTLRTEFTQTVAQNCSVPETGLFDTMAGRVITSMVVIMLAFAFYYTNAGNSTSLKIAGSGTYKKMKLFGLKITDPKEYFEEKIRRDVDK